MSRDRNDPPPRPGSQRLEFADQIEVQIEKIVTGGEGFARWHGIPVFVPRSAPDDRLLVKVTERHPDYGRGEIVRILEPGPGRREPPCPHFGSCGGCDLQHLEDELQSRLRAESVQETLVRLGGLRNGPEIHLVTGDAWAYRRRAQLHAEDREGQHVVGYRARGSRRLIPVDQCPILVPGLQQLLSELPDLLPEMVPKRLDLLVGDRGELTVAPVVAGLPHGEVRITVDDTVFELDARCFFQAHRGLLDTLVHTVVGEWGGREAFDIYAGVGLFALSLAHHYSSVVAIEGDRVAGRFLQRSARRNRIETIQFHHSAVDSWIDRLPHRPDRVVVDPPRTGLSGKVRDTLGRKRPVRLTYVSCDAASLARDLRFLSHSFEIERVTLLDMFPQTGHLEIVVQLVS